MLLTDNIFVAKKVSLHNFVSIPNCARYFVKLRKALLSKMRSNHKYSVDNIKLVSTIDGINL